jgi:hypothetical protein
MSDTPIDAQTLKDLPQGALETLLSTARAETGAAVAFVALYRADGSFAITTSMEEDASWEGNALASLARSIWLDPDLTVGKVLVSSARVDGGRMKRRQAHVASVVLSDAATSDLEWGLLSIIAHHDHKFSDEQVERIVALSKNLAAYLSARERMIDDLMDVVHEELIDAPSAPEDAGDNGPNIEDLITQPEPDDDVDSRASALEEQTRPSGEEQLVNPDLEEIIDSRRVVSDEEMRIEFEELSARIGSNGVRDVPARTVADEPNDEVHIIPSHPHHEDDGDDDGLEDVAVHAEVPDEVDAAEDVDAAAVTNIEVIADIEDIADIDDGMEVIEVAHVEDIDDEAVHAELPARVRDTADVESDETPLSPVPNLMIRVAEPGVIAHIADAMDAIGESVEYVALIHVKIAYDDTATTVPTEAARVLVAQSIKECVRFEDKVSRVGENSFVVVARLRPGSPEPAFIERRLVKAARRATGWSENGPSFRTDHLMVDSDSIDDPEVVLLALLHP